MGEAVYIDSAAVSREELGNPVYPPARHVLMAHGIACGAHAARQITKADYSAYDLLIGMDRSNLSGMRRVFGGDPEGKFRLLLDFTGAPCDVADPWYTDDFEAALPGYRSRLPGASCAAEQLKLKKKSRRRCKKRICGGCFMQYEATPCRGENR